MPFCLLQSVTVCENHASWGSLDDVMMVFVNQDAYDKFRMSKEDYELQKELEKEQEKAADKKDGKKEDKKEDKKEEADKVKDIVVELGGHSGPHRTSDSEFIEHCFGHSFKGWRKPVLPVGF